MIEYFYNLSFPIKAIILALFVALFTTSTVIVFYWIITFFNRKIKAIYENVMFEEYEKRGRERNNGN